MGWSQLVRRTEGTPIRLLPRCIITQILSVKRVIDDAARGGQAVSKSHANELVLYSPLTPAQYIAATLSFLNYMTEVSLAEDSWEGGGEDWPDAYHHCPMYLAESLACGMTWWH